jgi:hypothetical protein
LDTRLQNLTPEQRRLLAERLRARPPAAETAPIPRRSPDAPAVLSFGQQRLWFVDQLTPGNATYNVPNAVRLSGALNIKALSRALETIVRRHEVLRTTLAPIDGQPVPTVSQAWPSVLTHVDLTEWPASTRTAELERLLEHEARRPFDLSRDVMLRAVLVAVAPDDHLLLFVSHHIAWDPGSRAVFHNELERLYEGFSHGVDEPLPELPIQYADYAAWQRAWLQGELSRLVTYWAGQLKGAPPTLDQPIDRVRPAVSSQDGRKHVFAMPQETIAAAARFSARASATLFMTLLAAFNVFLAGRAGQTDLVLGSPIAGRSRPECEPLIGFFINTLALRTRLTTEQTFSDVVATVRKTAVDAYAHQELPFEKIVEAIRPPRDRSRHPIFQVNFRFAQSAARPLALHGLTVEPWPLVDTGTAKFDLALDIAAAAGGVSYFEYNTNLFEAATIVRMERDFLALVPELLSNADAPLATLPVFCGLRASAAGGSIRAPRFGAWHRERAHG